MQASATLNGEDFTDPGLKGWSEICGNRECDRGWLQLFRSRLFPRFESKWACSTGCMERIVADVVRSQIESWEPLAAIRPLRMPLGLILLSRGWITHKELQDALKAQSNAGHGLIGGWLRALHGVPETTIARALAIQWNCAVLPIGTPGIDYATSLLPAMLRRCYELTLLRQGADSSFYLAGKYRAEHAVAHAIEHMLRASVRAAFLEDSAWRAADDAERDDPEEAHAGRDGIVATIVGLVERTRPINARLARVHDHLWLRMWLRRRDRTVYVQDTVFPLFTGRQNLGLP